MMKNILSTLAVLCLFGASAVGAFLLYQRAFEARPVTRELGPEEAATEISLRLGKPFVKAWAARDVKALKSLTQGDFGGGMATNIEWAIENQPPFEKKQRTCDEEEQASTTEFDEFFSCLLDPIAGWKNVQTEFSILSVVFYSRKSGDLYQCRLLVSATGITGKHGVKTFQTEQEVIVTLPEFDSVIAPAFQSWQIREETIRESTIPVADQIFDLLSQQGIEVDDQSSATLDVADLDGDNDLDIAVTLAGGKRFVFAFSDQTYHDVTGSLGISSEAAQAQGSRPTRTAWFDFNQDGFPDLVSGDRMFENKNGQSFVDVTEKLDLTDLMGTPEIETMGRLRRHFRPE